MTETNNTITEFTQLYCHLCGEWTDVAQVQTHFKFAHDQEATFESLKERLSTIGGLCLRERPKDGEVQPKKKGNWLFNGDEDEIFQTNNFQHEGLRKK